jgi:glycosyltransferase involved in cell wall biosynthesis
MSQRRRRHDIAIHAPFAGKLYVTSDGSGADGAEVQMGTLAQALSARGLRVCHVVFDYEGIEPEAAGDVHLVRQPPEEFRTGLLPYSRSTMRALAEADADVYVQRTAGFETGLVATFARLRGRRFVFSSSSSTDLTRHPPLEGPAAAVSYRVGRRLAHELVVQTADQERLARETLGRPARLIRSFCESVPATEAEREAFLWIGGLIDYKDPLAYVRLAELVPEARFWMIPTSRSGWEWLGREVETAAERLPNLEVLPARDRSELFELYARAVAVVNTSSFEGFPNTFMEGWSCGAPALSLNVDPDGVIAGRGLGAVAGGSQPSLAEAARTLWARRLDMADTSRAARSYIAEHHDPHVVGAQWAELIAGLVEREL